jgi:CPA2 family monovalent cation:H+ antiporter-2
VAEVQNPTMRTIVRTRYIAEIEPLVAAGADRVIAEELEAVVQLFSDVMRSYDVAPEEILRHEDAVRHGGYAALRSSERATEPIAACDLDPDCLDRRTVPVRAGSPVARLAVRDLPLQVERVRRDETDLVNPAPDTALAVGDELTLRGTPDVLAQIAPLFRVGELDPGALSKATADPRTFVDTERRVELHVAPGATSCGHLDEVHAVTPSARGCEECLAKGDRWVHLRICMTCGHVGCCDSSPNKHARAHFRTIQHPIIRSLEPGESWGWCFVDELSL